MSAEKPLSPSTEHNNEVMGIMKHILDSEQLFDVVLIADDGKRIPSHRLMLSANSVYFRTMFTGAMKEAKEKEITICDIDGEILQTLVTHCYTGNLNLQQENVEKLFSSAHLLRFTSVVDKCARFLKTQLNISNCLGIKFFAEQYECPKLLERAQNFICKNFPQVVESEEFLKLSADQLGSILIQDDLNVPLEDDVFRSLMSWVRHDEVTRKKDISKLLLNVRIPLMSPKFVTEHVKSVCKDNKCMDLYYEALEYLHNPTACPDIDSKRIELRAASRGYLLAYTSYNRQFEKYCPKLNQWTPWKEMTLDGSNISFALWKNKVVMASRDSSDSFTVKYFDLKNQIWKNLRAIETKTSNSREFVYVKLVASGDSLYAFVGTDYNLREVCASRFDPESNSWKCVNSIPIPFGIHNLVAWDGDILLRAFSRDHGRTDKPRLLIYDTNTGNYTVLNTPVPSNIFVINDDLYGLKDSKIQLYNKTTNTWTTIVYDCPNIQTVCAFNNRFLVVEKENSRLLLKEYQFSDNKWIDLAPLSMTSIGECFYIPSSVI